MRALFSLCFLLGTLVCSAQSHGFRFGATFKDLGMTVYEKDSNAVAVVLNEFGEAHFDNENNNDLLIDYHIRIKILKQEGVRYANVEIPMHKQESIVERVSDIRASSFNLQGGKIVEKELDPRNVFTEDPNEYRSSKRFAIPNVQVGSVIEYTYRLQTPFYFNFKSWDFQSEIPKVYSEYWANIPANYIYKISLRGFYKLDKNDGEMIRDCYMPHGYHSDCSRLMWAMKDVPAFVEEKYMTAKSNFLSGINFELSEYHSFDGSKNKITKDWKDVTDELRQSERFGTQLRRGKDIVDEHIKVVVDGETDPLMKAKKVYEFIRDWYTWDGVYGKYSEFGIKKAFDKKKGNVGDINLSLIAALKYADFNVESMLLSTRDNGVVTELHPVLSEFNYVIAKLNINEKVYLLDATDPFQQFGLLPERCLNGKGRVLTDRDSYWYDIKPSEKSKNISLLNLVIDANGLMKGSIQTTYFGYEAVNERKRIFYAESEKEYIDQIRQKYPSLTIQKYEILNLNDLTKPLIVKLEIESEIFNSAETRNFLFNPFIVRRVESNPFKTEERFYPVDFATAQEEVSVVNLEFPEAFSLSEIPQKIGLALPNAGGRFIYDVQLNGRKLAINYSLYIAKPVFTPEEYHFLKELFTRVISVQNQELVFSRK